MQTYTDFDQVPIGLYIFLATHASSGPIRHIGLKTRQAPWFDQPACPFYSQAATKDLTDFWTWAEANLPTFAYANVIKSAT